MYGPFHQEAPEGKRKSVKRAFKSEKEFLEFTLKYQQVLSERDSGWLLLFLPLICVIRLVRAQIAGFIQFCNTVIYYLNNSILLKMDHLN